ncbi:hypothetical protein SAMN05192583_2209 [Sphingomonas gellani]|uniref:WYL domain-containing protein n=1 Tax=Sphingomonas gellani TaxID=1166340 RepID=A0A1H8EK17_9SPHN|nr:hypothetical protein [Sphingomonas gellani]SEN19736.1 hypothetical protein SAMN05192583_2209 [Sphingomonas gellani]
MSDDQSARPAPAPETTPIVFEAIVKQLAIAATYNRGEVTLAPHILYTRHGELYLDAVTLERDGKPPREVKMGTFKLAGLQPLRLTARRFIPSELFQSADEKYVGVTLMAI